ncbi:MAG TPA: hypothetical protein VFV99_12975 [Kofleriaceae bacterium]|nr:hypothetical protein [Kofleriaceae bacterium]
MVPPKTWLAIPIMAIACAAVAALLGEQPSAAVAIGALAAAAAAAVRAFAGASVAAATTASAAALLVALGVLDLPHFDVPRATLAAAAALFAIAELARPLPVDASPLPAIGAALLAGVLDPAYVALLAIAGIRLLTGPWSRPRWTVLVPIVGMLAIGIAVLAACAERGVFAELWHTWAARTGTHAPLTVLTQAADTLGPIATIAALAGLAVCALRGRYAAAATLAVAIGAVAVDLAVGSLGAATLAIAAVGAGVGLARLAATVRWPTAQTFVGATAGFLVVVAAAMLRL